MEATLASIRSLMPGLKVPQHYDKVYKDECIFTFDTPFSPGGLCVNLRSWHGFATDHVEQDLQRSGCKGSLYLLQKFTRKAKAKSEEAKGPSKISDLLGEEKWEVIKEHSLLVVDPSGSKTTVALPCPELPMIVTDVCDAIIAHQGAKSMDDTARWNEDQEIQESKYVKDLVQLPATKKISPNPKDWKCEVSGDTQNLWLNLSDGHIGGGRRFWDGTGGSNGALDHFNEEKAKGNFYPLVVKLGTITPHGADVYSYAPDEDNMVKDPLLAQHLAHWGIDSMKMDKTEKTMAELEVEKNLNHDWSKICESGHALVRLRGPGLVGLKNLGNTCYMNSTLQLFAALPEVRDRYQDDDFKVRKQAPADAHSDLIGQVAKLVTGLASTRYAPPLKDDEDEDDPSILVAPQMFRGLIGKNHPEFSSGRQQDAAEFLQYFLEQIQRAERTAVGSRLDTLTGPTESLFAFQVEERLEESSGSGRVKYSRIRQNMLGLPVKLEDAENLLEVNAFSEEKEAKKPKVEGESEEPKPIISPKTCLERFAAPETGISFRGGTATKTSRLASMPRYLLVQVQRYYLDEKWTPTKLDCKVPMPETLNLEHLRGTGLQPGETELPEDATVSAAAQPPPTASQQPDELIVAQLLSMGLNENAAKRACLAVQNSDAEAATAWYFEHSEDPGINDPLVEPAGGQQATPQTTETDPEAVEMLCSLGFAQVHVMAALKSCMNNSERAADWLFSHADDLESATAAVTGQASATGSASNSEQFHDGVGEYELVGFISHIGKHTSHGHYVCHMKKSDGWVIFDDQKVARSESPPLDLGYIYLYHRKDAI